MEGFDPKQESQGVGDTIAKVTSFFGIDKVADAVAKLAGMPGCGCSERRQMLNELFPYENKTRKFKVLKPFNFADTQYFEGQEVSITSKDTLIGGVIVLAKDGFLEEIL